MSCNPAQYRASSTFVYPVTRTKGESRIILAPLSPHTHIHILYAVHTVLTFDSHYEEDWNGFFTLISISHEQQFLYELTTQQEKRHKYKKEAHTPRPQTGTKSEWVNQQSTSTIEGSTELCCKVMNAISNVCVRHRAVSEAIHEWLLRTSIHDREAGNMRNHTWMVGSRPYLNISPFMVSIRHLITRNMQVCRYKALRLWQIAKVDNG